MISRLICTCRRIRCNFYSRCVFTDLSFGFLQVSAAPELRRNAFRGLASAASNEMIYTNVYYPLPGTLQSQLHTPLSSILTLSPRILSVDQRYRATQWGRDGTLVLLREPEKERWRLRESGPGEEGSHPTPGSPHMFWNESKQ